MRVFYRKYLACSLVVMSLNNHDLVLLWDESTDSCFSFGGILMKDLHFKKAEAPEQNDEFFRITAENFPALKGMAIQDLDMAPGEIRRAHLHPNAMQMDYCISGSGEVGIVGPGGRREVFQLSEGDAAFIPQGYVHWIKNTAESSSRFVLVVSTESPETIEVAEIGADLLNG